MTGTQAFSYKPALLRGAVRITLDGTTLAGPDGTLDLARVEEAAFVNHVLKGNRLIRLDLFAGDARHSLSFNGDAKSWHADPDAQAHLAAVAACLRALERAQPGAEVALGVIRGGRWGMFLIGAGAALGGGTLAVAALASGVSGDRMVAAAIPTLLLIALGGVLLAGNWPWRSRPRVRAHALAETLEALVPDPADPTPGAPRSDGAA